MRNFGINETQSLPSPGILQTVLGVIQCNIPAKKISITAGKPTISLKEVACHDTYGDCWIIIYDRVYNVTSFLEEHPGGSDVLLEHAGRDASVAFRGSGHSKLALKSLERFLIGELPDEERIFRKVGGYQLSDID